MSYQKNLGKSEINGLSCVNLYEERATNDFLSFVYLIQIDGRPRVVPQL